jgi:hypothetical protein
VTSPSQTPLSVVGKLPFREAGSRETVLRVNSWEDLLPLLRAEQAVPSSRAMGPQGLHHTAATRGSSHQPLPAEHEAFTSMLNALCIIVSPSNLRSLSVALLRELSFEEQSGADWDPRYLSRE